MKIIIEAANQNRVKRIVVTSSLASMAGGCYKKGTGDKVYGEKDLAPILNADSYAIGKIAQEKVINAFLKNQDENPN
jgi:nucleoside-diphosphate-sugar epimerase